MLSHTGLDGRRLSSEEPHGYVHEVADKILRRDAALLQDLDGRFAEAGLSVEPASACIGAYVHGINMAEVTDAQVSLIWELIYSHKVVFFRDQGHISRKQHIAFGRRFAEVGLAFGRHQALSANTSPDEYPEILPLYSDKNAPFVPANWHSDVTWAEKPPLGSILLTQISTYRWRHHVCR